MENLTIVGLSRWITECAKQSKLLGDKRIVNIPNPRDTDRFKPIDERLARDILNLPKDKKLILFGAVNAINDPRKGFKELSHALKKLKSKEVELIVFGSSEPQNPPDFCFAAHYLGHQHDDISLQILYNASEVVVVPSLQENLSNTIMESLSCGTPVVAFDVGGNSDMIEHQRNGYLAKPYDAIDLAYGIDWVLNNQSYAELSKNARDKVLKEFDSSIVVKKYISLYQEILSNANPF
jgi:glycosyltransferase involved in cell wall biosynthesis